MGKFISIPVDGGVTTRAAISITTVTAGVPSGITVGTAGVAYTFVPKVVVTTTDGQGSGLVVSASTLVAGVPTFTVVSAGSGYTSISTIILTVVPPSLYINADQVLSIATVATGSATASNATLVIKMNTASTPTLTLTLANAINVGTFNSDGAFAVKDAITKAIMDATNVKLVDQVTPVTLPSTCLVNQYAYS